MAYTCFEDTALRIKLSQDRRYFDSFTVTYGLQVRGNLDYASAAAELGRCLMHAIACEGRLDNRTKAEARKVGDGKPYFSAEPAVFNHMADRG